MKMKCTYCEYGWEPRVANPKSCPRCKRRFDYMKVRQNWFEEE